MLLRLALLCCGVCCGALVLGHVASCSPELQEGVYGCDDGECPEGWSCDLDSKRCYSKARVGSGDDGDRHDAGMRDGATDDPRDGGGSGTSGGRGGRSGGGGEGEGGGSGAGNGGSGGSGGSGSGGEDGGSGGLGSGGLGGSTGSAPLYAACSDAAECADGACTVGPDPMATHGTCSKLCSSDSQCQPVGGTTGVCIPNLDRCLQSCDGSTSCEDGLACHDIATGPMMPTKTACIEIASANLMGTTSCTMANMMTSCGRGATCANDGSGGLCSYRCDQSGNCPNDGPCIQVFPNVSQCFKACGSGGAGECGELVCRAFGGEQVCIPSAWEGKTPPLQPPPM